MDGEAMDLERAVKVYGVIAGVFWILLALIALAVGFAGAFWLWQHAF